MNAVLLHCQLVPNSELDTEIGAAILSKATQASAKAAITSARRLPVHRVRSIASLLLVCAENRSGRALHL